MGSCSIALKMFRNNLRTHGLYLGVLVFAVAVYYEFMFLKYSPEFAKAQEMKQIVQISATMTSFLMVVILFFFLFFSSSFFLKQRKKEIAVYAFMGISNRRIGRVFAIENLITGLVTVVLGLGVGILFSRLFMMAVAKVALLDVTLTFSVPLAGVIELVVVFGSIFLGLSVWHFIQVARSTLIDLIRDKSKDEGVPKRRILRAILSVLFIGAGYWLSENVVMMLPVVVLVVIGTFWLFGALVPAVGRWLAKSPRRMYKGVRLIGISNILFRLRSNYRSLAMMAVMTATTVTAFGTAVSLKYYVGATQHVNYPWTFSYTLHQPETQKNVEGLIAASDHALLDEVHIEVLTVGAFMDLGMKVTSDSVDVVRLSDLQKVQDSIGKRFPGKAEPVPILADDEAAYVFSPAMVGGFVTAKGRTVSLSGGTLNIVTESRASLFGRGGALYQTDVLVVNDTLYEKLASDAQKKTLFHGYAVENAKQSGVLGDAIRNLLPPKVGFMSYADVYASEDSFFGLFFFLGTFLSMVFLLATGSIFYFKTLSEGLADRDKYGVLWKLGLTDRELRASVRMQVGLPLIVPLAVGLLHSVFAVAELSDLLSYSLNVPMAVAVAIYLLCYGIIYAMTARKFLQLVHPEAS